MNSELDKQLCEKYPKIFANRHAPMTVTAMCWGFDVGDGWYNIIDALCANIQHHVDSTNKRRELLLKDNTHNFKIPDEVHQPVAAQVKEKFGTLRFYIDGGNDVTHAMINLAESMSARTCETCGSPGKRRGGGWIYTACDEHTREEDKEETEDA
jgi:hypothetical protein